MIRYTDNDTDAGSDVVGISDEEMEWDPEFELETKNKAPTVAVGGPNL